MTIQVQQVAVVMPHRVLRRKHRKKRRHPDRKNLPDVQDKGRQQQVRVLRAVVVVRQPVRKKRRPKGLGMLGSQKALRKRQLWLRKMVCLQRLKVALIRLSCGMNFIVTAIVRC